MPARKAAALLLAVAVGASSAQIPPADALERAREEYAWSVGVQAYIYGFPLVVMGLTRTGMTTSAQVNSFVHYSELVTPEAKGVVAPNVDTLYSTAWLDLAGGPVKLRVPEMGKRYFVFQFLDAATNNFAYIGTRSTGPHGGDWLITGPFWKGRVPGGLRRIASPTDTVWIIFRVLVDGPDDVPNARMLQDQIVMGKLGEPAPPAQTGKFGSAKPVLPRVDAMNAQEFFGGVAKMLKQNPPLLRDEAMLTQLQRIGLKAGAEFDIESLDTATRRGVAKGLESGRGIVAGMGRPETQLRNGWSFGNNRPWGTDYLRRAQTARGGLGALDPEEAIYAGAARDSAGEPLTGSRRYSIRFERGQTPPVNAFWSVTLYRPDRFVVSNPVRRYAIGDRTHGLQYGADGSLEIYIQREAPAGKESNWLPSAEGGFSLALRMYLPKPEVVDGSWKPPQVRRAD